jgi:hypothetical protein
MADDIDPLDNFINSADKVSHDALVRKSETLLLIGYFRKITNLPLAEQLAMADRDGVGKRSRHIEKTGEITEVRESAFGAQRSDSRLWVADLTVLTDNRDKLVLLLKDLSAKKHPVVIQEGRAGRVSLPPHDGQHMAIEALARWSRANGGFGLMTAHDAGSKGGKVASKRRRKQRLPNDLAKSIWFDKSLLHLKTDEIVAKIVALGQEQGFGMDWTQPSLYRAFGKRGADAGPKTKLK